MHFGVIGSGVVGFNTALALQKEFPTENVTIFEDDDFIGDTSCSKADLFRPALSLSGTSEQITKQWITESFSYWDAIRSSSESTLAGITEMSGYAFSSSNEQIAKDSNLENLLHVYRPCMDDELKICPGNWKYGLFFTSTFTDYRLYQKWATKKFLLAGGNIIKKKVTNLFELGSTYDILFNCCGLGANMEPSSEEVPIRELTVIAPWIKIAIFTDFDAYVIPGITGEVTMGGPILGDNTVRERCEQILPSLKTACVIREHVSLRLTSNSIRVESESIINPETKQTLKVIHNYGHGDYGVSISPGTAAHAVRISKSFLAST